MALIITKHGILVNDYAVKNAVRWTYAAAVGSYGVTLNVLPGITACLACIFRIRRREWLDLRNLGDFEYRSQRGGIDCGDGSGEVASWRSRGAVAPDIMVV
jgi:hypothetical protein